MHEALFLTLVDSFLSFFCLFHHVAGAALEVGAGFAIVDFHLFMALRTAAVLQFGILALPVGAFGA